MRPADRLQHPDEPDPSMHRWPLWVHRVRMEAWRANDDPCDEAKIASLTRGAFSWKVLAPRAFARCAAELAGTMMGDPDPACRRTAVLKNALKIQVNAALPSSAVPQCTPPA